MYPRSATHPQPDPVERGPLPGPGRGEGTAYMRRGIGGRTCPESCRATIDAHVSTGVSSDSLSVAAWIGAGPTRTHVLAWKRGGRGRGLVRQRHAAGGAVWLGLISPQPTGGTSNWRPSTTRKVPNHPRAVPPNHHPPGMGWWWWWYPGGRVIGEESLRARGARTHSRRPSLPSRTCPCLPR